MAEPRNITILGLEFPCSMPYDAGHTINEAEAKVLNQTRRENLSNNFRKNVKAYQDGEEGAMTLDQLGEAFSELDAGYAFTLSNATAARKLDPVEREARSLARTLIRDELAKSGRKLTVAPDGETDESWSEKVEGEVDRIAAMDEVVKQAKKIVAERSKVATITLGELGLGGEEGQQAAAE